MLELEQRYRGCLLGLATGDAVGTTLEFKERGTFSPVVDMMGGGPFNLQPGQWTDDTSMALCLAYSLLEQAGFDADDQMQRYCRWRETGYLSSTGRCFDIGVTVTEAISRYRQSGDPFSGSTDPFSAGNGSLMRLAPVALFYAPNLAAMIQYCGESSRTTHGAIECIEACQLFASMLHAIFEGADKYTVLHQQAFTPQAPSIARIAAGDYLQKSWDQLRGSGYVVACLEAALWCFAHTESFHDAILAAANLGDDADTTAAVCGQIAGAYYGDSGIPSIWLDKLYWRTEISDLADRLYAVNT